MRKIFKQHRMHGILFLFLMVFFVFSAIPTTAQDKSEDAEKEVTTEAPSTDTDKESPELIPCINEDILLYCGETRFLDIKYVGGASSVKLSSSEPSVLKVTGSGRMKAQKCGKSVVTVTLKKGKKVSQAKLNVTVKYSSFFSSGKYAKAIKKDNTNKKNALIDIHIVQQQGTSKKLRLSGIEESAKISYTSSNSSVARVDSNGNVTAIKPGKATIKTVIKQNNKNYVYIVTTHVRQGEEKAKITQKDIDKYIGKSAFLGNSVSLGLEYYFNTKESTYLGAPLVLARECYNFYIDASSSYMQYKPKYKGVADSAANLIYKSKIKRVFINMGTNDLGISGVEGTYKNYVDYLKKIRKKNPNVIIFIQSMTPMYKGSDVGTLSNVNIDKLNAKLEAYCSTQPDMYYIDISTALKGPDGTMRPEYSSDNYVHITMAGYATWINEVCDYVEELLLKETLARDAVKTALQSRDKTDYTAARKLVNALEKGSVKTRLSDKLDKIKNKVK